MPEAYTRSIPSCVVEVSSTALAQNIEKLLETYFISSHTHCEIVKMTKFFVSIYITLYIIETS